MRPMAVRQVAPAHGSNVNRCAAVPQREDFFTPEERLKTFTQRGELRCPERHANAKDMAQSVIQVIIKMLPMGQMAVRHLAVSMGSTK